MTLFGLRALTSRHFGGNGMSTGATHPAPAKLHYEQPDRTGGDSSRRHRICWYGGAGWLRVSLDESR